MPGCLSRVFPNWPRRGLGGLLGGLVLVSVVVIVGVRGCARDGSPRAEDTSASATVTTGESPSTTTSTTTARATATTRGSTAESTVRPLPVDVSEILERHCVAPPGGGAAVGSLETLFQDRPSVDAGPDEGATPPPLGSADPALEMLRVLGVSAGCGDTRYPVVAVEFGGPLDHVQVGVAIGNDPKRGFHARPDASEGLGRVAGWDVVCFVEPDGSASLYDFEYRQVGMSVEARVVGSYLIVAMPETTSDQFDWHVQSFRRDGTTAQDPVDWSIAGGTSSPAA